MWHNIMRPYPETGLTTERWMNEVPVRAVNMHELVFTQEEISLIKVLEAIKGAPNVAGDKYPHVVHWLHNDVMYLEDGHHRVAVKLLTGKTNMTEARVLEIP